MKLHTEGSLTIPRPDIKGYTYGNAKNAQALELDQAGSHVWLVASDCDLHLTDVAASFLRSHG